VYDIIFFNTSSGQYIIYPIFQRNFEIFSSVHSAKVLGIVWEVFIFELPISVHRPRWIGNS